MNLTNIERLRKSLYQVSRGLFYAKLDRDKKKIAELEALQKTLSAKIEEYEAKLSEARKI